MSKVIDMLEAKKAEVQAEINDCEIKIEALEDRSENLKNKYDYLNELTEEAKAVEETDSSEQPCEVKQEAPVKTGFLFR